MIFPNMGMMGLCKKNGHVVSTMHYMSRCNDHRCVIVNMHASYSNLNRIFYFCPHISLCKPALLLTFLRVYIAPKVWLGS